MPNKMERIIGDFKPGYFYGNVKSHKGGNPLRPIISQIPLPTYRLAKKLNGILQPYIPTTYSLRSTSEFVAIIRSNERRGMLASLDVTSLFTNVPLEKTIDILANYAYHHDSLAAPEIPEKTMKAMLRLCTKEAPFRSPQGEMFQQVDGIAMGSPLGVLFAQAYMAAVEEQVLAVSKPYVYARYIDDIYVDIENADALQDLQRRLESASGLNFTIEHSTENRINFLDVAVDASGPHMRTDVYRKPTDAGKCLHGQSECPVRYKESVIRAYVHRAIKHCSTWEVVSQ